MNSWRPCWRCPSAARHWAGRSSIDLPVVSGKVLLDVEVGSVEQLQRVQAALRATSCVTAVERNLG